MTIFEIIILASFYVFTVAIEASFLVNEYEGRQKNRIDRISCLLIIIFAPIFLALQLGDIIYKKSK